MNHCLEPLTTEEHVAGVRVKFSKRMKQSQHRAGSELWPCRGLCQASELGTYLGESPWSVLPASSGFFFVFSLFPSGGRDPGL